MQKALIKNALVASLGGLLFGFDTAVISGTTEAIKAAYSLDSKLLGFTVASALIGTIIGAIGISKPSDRYGRKKALFLLAVFYLISALGCGFAWDWYSLLAFRFLGGLAVGGASVVSPMYIAEISPAASRGRLVALTQFNIVLGILLAYLSNWLITMCHLGELEWRVMLGIEAFPAAIFYLLLFTTPESPRWLLAQNKQQQAREILTRLHSEQTAQTEIISIQKAIEQDKANQQTPFYCRSNTRPILLAIAIAAFNQLSGINAILYYAPSVFKMAGAGTESALGQSAVIGLTNLIFTMLAMTIIDRFGRKKLMLVGSLGYLVSLSLAAAAFFYYGQNFSALGGEVVLAAIIAFIAAHAFGQGAVIWVFISEIFPTHLRARGQSLGSVTHWVMAAAISWTFPPVADKLGAGWVFAFYAVMMAVQLYWVLTVMPETKGIALEDIQKQLAAAGNTAG